MTPSVTWVPTAVHDVLSSSYEELRCTAIAGADRQSCAGGLALFIRTGMARWMDICVDLLARPAMPVPLARHVQKQPFGPDIRIEVAMILAQMAISVHTQGATAC